MTNNITFDIINDDSKIYNDFCLIGGMFETGDFSSTIINEINTKSNGYITSILNNNEYTGKIGETILLHYIPNTQHRKILLVGCGKKNIINKKNYKKIIYQSINALKNANTKKIIFLLTELNIDKCNYYWKIRYAIEIIQNISYVFKKFKNSTTNDSQKLQTVIFYSKKNSSKFEDNKKAIIDGTIISNNINIAKNMGNMPPNICNSEYLIEKSKKLKEIGDYVSTEIITENQMKKLGMNAYLAVGKSSKNPSLISIIKYSGQKKQKKQPLILIGKGVTFDSGGLSIKPSEKMDEMKYDMCGAASVYAILRIAIQLKLPINIIGILATCENMITNSSLRPGDILHTLSGQTVEIKNTDAEGRLILCDVLTYVLQFNPEIIIDIATLTGACVIALGHHFTGLISNYDPLANQLIQAGEETDDKIWRLPLAHEFQEQINSNIADIKNTGGGTGGAITAGCFLQRFIGKHHWAHLDIAGTAWTSDTNNNQATGRPVGMMAQFLINYAKQHNNS